MPNKPKPKAKSPRKRGDLWRWRQRCKKENLRATGILVCITDEVLPRMLVINPQDHIGRLMCPQGGLNPKESLERCATREGSEESGVKLKKRKVGNLYELLFVEIDSFDLIKPDDEKWLGKSYRHVVVKVPKSVRFGSFRCEEEKGAGLLWIPVTRESICTHMCGNVSEKVERLLTILESLRYLPVQKKKLSAAA